MEPVRRVLMTAFLRAGIRLVRRRKVTVRLQIGFPSSDLSVGGLGELTELSFGGGSLSGTFFFRSTAALFQEYRYRPIQAS